MDRVAADAGAFRDEEQVHDAHEHDGQQLQDPRDDPSPPNARRLTTGAT